MKIFLLIAMVFFVGCSKKVIKSDVIPVVETVVQDGPVMEFGMDNESQVQPKAEAAPVYFEYDRSDISYEAAGILETISKMSFQSLTITGNCDERGSDAYNYALGMRRAEAARDWLTAHGVDVGKIATVSNGRGNLVNLNCSDDWCHAKNRRCEFKLKP